MLSGGTTFRDNEIGMTRSNPNFLHSGQLFEPAYFLFVSPDHQVFSRGRAARMNPSLFHPVMDGLLDDTEFACQVWNPPFVFLQQIVPKELSDQSLSPHQNADHRFGKDAAAGWDEALGVELGG